MGWGCRSQEEAVLGAYMLTPVVDRDSLITQWRVHLQCRRPRFDPWVGKIPRRRERLPSPVFWPGEFHGLYSPWGCKESDTTEQLSLNHSAFVRTTLTNIYQSHIPLLELLHLTTNYLKILAVVLSLIPLFLQCFPVRCTFSPLHWKCFNTFTSIGLTRWSLLATHNGWLLYPFKILYSCWMGPVA